MLMIIDGFSLFGLEIKFYGIIMALSMLIGVLLACKNAKKRGLVADDIYLIALYVLPLSVIGARLFYVLGDLDSFSSFWQVFNTRTGGMSIYGGVIGGALGVLIFCLVHKKNFLAVGDIAVVSLILGQAIGRWGNFFNQEVYGSVVNSTSWQWFPFAVFIENTGNWHYALFFYEMLLNLLIFSILFYLLKKIRTNGYVTSIYLICYGTIRFILEPLRDSTYNLMLFGFKLSSVTSILAIILGIAIFVFVYTKQRRRKKVEKE